MAKPEEVLHGWMFGRKFRLKRDYTHVDGFQKGDIVKVMVSRLGDVGLTKDFQAECGYKLRVYPKELEALEPIPDSVWQFCYYEHSSTDKCPQLARL